MTNTAVITEIAGPVCTIVLNRPDQRNAVDRPLRAAFEAFDADDTLRVAVLAGSGGHFCAGADLAAQADTESSTRKPRGN